MSGLEVAIFTYEQRANKVVSQVQGLPSEVRVSYADPYGEEKRTHLQINKTTGLLPSLRLAVSSGLAGLAFVSGVCAGPTEKGFYSSTSGRSFDRSIWGMRYLQDGQPRKERVALGSRPQNRQEQRTTVQQLQPGTGALQRQPVPIGRSSGILEEQIYCAALNIYHEARSESPEGQFAVAEVTINRADESNKSVCHIVMEPNQFSWTKDGIAWTGRGAKAKWHVTEGFKPKDRQAWHYAQWVAKTVLIMPKTKREQYTHGATYYHADYVAPSWSFRFKKVTKIGQHIFYRPNTDQPYRALQLASLAVL